MMKVIFFSQNNVIVEVINELVNMYKSKGGNIAGLHNHRKARSFTKVDINNQKKIIIKKLVQEINCP